MLTQFQQKVYEVVKKIPKGQTLTYKQVAQKIGRPHAYRAVGSALKKNYASGIPCHRVIRSDGKLGEYNRGAEMKEKILKKEKALINKICSRGHKYKGGGPCPICWPGRLKKSKNK